MQISETFSGEVTLEAKTESRERSFGSTGTVSVYPSKVDTINSIIANFLRVTCGVDAYYEERDGSDYRFLWIYDVPFLLSFSGTANNAVFYPPFGAASVSTSTDGTSVSNFFSGAKYSFGIVFCGNPNNGFSMRFKTYNSTSVSTNLVLRFMRGENIINGENGVVWNAKSIYSTGNQSDASPMLGGANGVDLNNRTVSAESFSTGADMYYTPRLFTKEVHRTSNDGALPLVPLCIGPYRINGMYLHPRHFGLPAAHSLSTEVQAEVTIGDRSFLVTANESGGCSYINMGLIETT